MKKDFTDTVTNIVIGFIGVVGIIAALASALLPCAIIYGIYWFVFIN